MSDLQTLRRIEQIERTLERLQTVERPMAGGTAFPSTPPTGFLFFRSDLGWLCYYDGTRWLTENEFSLSSGLRAAPTPGTYVIGPLRQDYDPYITRVERLINTGATNNGSNWVQITVLGASANQGATTTIDVANTSAQSGNTWATNGSTPSATAVPANNAALDFSIANSGSPSNLQNLVLNVFYRLIVT